MSGLWTGTTQITVSMLAERIVEPACELMRKAGSNVMMFECFRTVITFWLKEMLVKLVDHDQNIRCLGL